MGFAETSPHACPAQTPHGDVPQRGPSVLVKLYNPIPCCSAGPRVRTNLGVIRSALWGPALPCAAGAGSQLASEGNAAGGNGKQNSEQGSAQR